MALATRTPQQSLIEGFYELEIVSHLAHVNTRSFAEHGALGAFYDKVGDFKDRLVEYLMGEGKLTKLNITVLDPAGSTIALADSLATRFCDFAENAEDEALCNMAGEFEETVARLKYMMMLK